MSDKSGLWLIVMVLYEESSGKITPRQGQPCIQGPVPQSLYLESVGEQEGRGTAKVN